MIKKVEELDTEVSTEFKNSERIYVENNNSTVRVPMREIKLSPTNKPDVLWSKTSLLEFMILPGHGEIKTSMVITGKVYQG